MDVFDSDDDDVLHKFISICIDKKITTSLNKSHKSHRHTD